MDVILSGLHKKRCKMNRFSCTGSLHGSKQVFAESGIKTLIKVFGTGIHKAMPAGGLAAGDMGFAALNRYHLIHVKTGFIQGEYQFNIKAWPDIRAVPDLGGVKAEGFTDM